MKKLLLTMATLGAILPWPAQAATKPTDLITIINEEIPAYMSPPGNGPATIKRYQKPYSSLVLNPKEKGLIEKALNAVKAKMNSDFRLLFLHILNNTVVSGTYLSVDGDVAIATYDGKPTICSLSLTGQGGPGGNSGQPCQNF